MARRSVGSSRRSRDEDERPEERDEDLPRRGRGRERDRDDDPDEDEPPRRSRGRGRSSRDEEPEDEPRGRSSRSRNDDDDDAPRGRRSRDRDEEDDAPARGRRDSARDEKPKGRSTTTGKGWGGYAKVKDADNDFTNPWPLPTKRTLIKFLDAEPFFTYAEHWIERKGKKSWICLGEGCPLCATGDKPRGFGLLNILDLSDPDEPTNEFLRVGKRVAQMLEDFSADKPTSPINRDDLYWVIWKTEGKGGNQQTNLNPVKERDVEDDYDFPPFTPEELDEFFEKVYDEDVMTIPTKAELKEVAREIED